MKIVVNHLTRMQPGYICVAGIDTRTRAHVRPVLPRGRLTSDLLKRHGGPFDIAVVVDLGTVQPQGRPPETEDHIFDPSRIVMRHDMSAGSFWELLEGVCCGTFAEVFGDALEARGSGCTVDEGTGTASLGCVQLAKPPEIFINPFGKVRANVSDGSLNLDLSVTDLRFYEKDHRTPRAKMVDNVERRIGNGVAVILSEGWLGPSRHRVTPREGTGCR